MSVSAAACVLHPLAHCYRAQPSVGPQAGNQPRRLLLLLLLLWASGDGKKERDSQKRAKNNALVKDLTERNPTCRTVGGEKNE